MRPTDGWWVVTDRDEHTASIVFEWEPVAGAAGYVLFLSDSKGLPILNYVDVGNTNHWPEDSTTGGRIVLPAGNYLWSLIAYNGADPREYGGWNCSPRTPTAESPIFFQVIRDLTVPTIYGATKAGVDTVSITWAGPAPAFVDVRLFYPGSGGWLDAYNQPVAATGAKTGTVILGHAWGVGVTNYLLLTGRTAAGATGPKSRLFVIP
jgi:hypothetical protein